MSAYALPHNHQLADTTYEHLQEDIREAEAGLGDDDQLEVLYYPGGHHEAVIRVTAIGFWNPFTIRLYGVDSEGNDCTCLVHMNSLALVLKTAKRQVNRQRIPIGFRG